MAKSKKSPHRYNVYTFVVKEAFPSDSELAVDLLRLMAAYNDMSEVIDWMKAHRSIATRPVAFQKARLRLAIQHRFLLALMHEAFRIIDQLQSNGEFVEAKRLLSPEGEQALKQLLLAAGGGPQSVRTRLKVARDKVTFHYDGEDFRKGLDTFPRIFTEKEKAKSKFLFRHNERAYYMLPEQVREIIVYGFDSLEDAAKVKEKLGPFLAEVIRLQRELFDFLEDLLVAYMKLRGVEHCFNHAQIHE